MSAFRKTIGLSLTAIIGIAFALWLTLRAPEVYVQGTYVFGTRVQLALYGVPLDRAQQATNAVFAHFQAMHRGLHAWQPSDVTRLNRSLAAGEPFHAPPSSPRSCARRAVCRSTHRGFSSRASDG